MSSSRQDEDGAFFRYLTWSEEDERWQIACTDVFKPYTSMTPHQYFISIKIVRAKELLRQGLPIKEVAYRVGFSDQYYFSRLFKNKTGLSPSRWLPQDRK